MIKRKISFNSPVVLWFAIISFIVLIVDKLTSGISTSLLFCTYKSSLLSPFTYLRLFTHCLGHANFEHYFGNMTYFLLLGPMLEEKYGSKNLIKCILITAGITAILNAILFPNTAVLGASGIVFMFIVMSSVTNFEDGKIPLTLILIILIYVGQEVYNALFVIDTVSQFSHIIGGLIGGFLGIRLNHER